MVTAAAVTQPIYHSRTESAVHLQAAEKRVPCHAPKCEFCCRCRAGLRSAFSDVAKMAGIKGALG